MNKRNSSFDQRSRNPKVPVLGQNVLTKKERSVLHCFCRVALAAIMILLSGVGGYSANHSFPVREDAAANPLDAGRRVFPVLQNGRIGFVDQDGQLAIEATFDKEARPVGYVGPSAPTMISVKNWGTEHRLTYDKSDVFDFFPQFHNGIAVVARNQKIGFIREDGTVLCDPQFEMVTCFDSGLAWVLRETKHFLIDDRGDVLAGGFDDHRHFSAMGGAVLVGERWGLIDTTGKFLVEPRFKHVHQYHEGLAVVEDEGRLGAVDRLGKYVVEPTFDHLRVVSPSVLQCCLAGAWGLMDRTGRFLVRPQYENVGEGFAEGLVPVKHHGKWGYLDDSGKFAIQPQFDGARPFHDGRASVMIVRELGAGLPRTVRWGVINRRGDFVVQPQFKEISEFVGGSAVVEDSRGRCGLIDRSGKFLLPLHENCCHIASGIVRYQGEWNEHGGNHDEIVRLRSDTGNAWTAEGFIDRAGRFLLRPEFREIRILSSGLALVRDDSPFRIVDMCGRTVVAFDRDYCWVDPVASEGLRAVGLGNDAVDDSVVDSPGLLSGRKFGFVNEWGETVIDAQFDHVERFDRGLARVNIGGKRTIDGRLGWGKWGYINRRGELVSMPTR